MRPGEAEPGGVEADALDGRLGGGVDDEESVGIEAAVLGDDDAFVFALGEVQDEIFGRDGFSDGGDLPAVGQRVAAGDRVWRLREQRGEDEERCEQRVVRPEHG